jgi:hypothetical protein
MLEAPQIDDRSAADLARQLRLLLALYQPGVETRAAKGSPLSALIEIFARYGEIVIDRLNRAPEKNFLAFLDLVEVSPQPARAAKAPLTFYLSAPNVASAVVPAGTQVAAQLAQGETKPVIFETQQDLVVVAVNLDAVILKDSGNDQYFDFSSAIAPQTPPPEGQGALMAPAGETSAATAVPHLLYFAFPPATNLPVRNRLTLHFSTEASGKVTADEQRVQWEVPSFPGPASMGEAPCGESLSFP